MDTRLAEAGSFVAAIGVVLILRAASRARYIATTASSLYVSVPMQVLTYRLAPLNVEGSDMTTDELTAKTSLVLVGYVHRVDGKAYVSNSVFPMAIEWRT